MSDLLTEARQYFSTMPDEVVENWLKERVESRGWPPQGPEWKALLRFYTPPQWQKFSWEKRELDLGSIPFSAKSRDIIIGLAAARFDGVRNSYSNIENSVPRMERICRHLVQSGKLPGTIVLIADREWEIVDGSHRISCYFALRDLPGLCAPISPGQLAWIATPAEV